MRRRGRREKRRNSCQKITNKNESVDNFQESPPRSNIYDSEEKVGQKCPLESILFNWSIQTWPVPQLEILLVL